RRSLPPDPPGARPRRRGPEGRSLKTEAILFWSLAALAVGPALLLLFQRDIVRAAFALLLSFLGFAGLYVLLGADFLAAAQVLVCAGGLLTLLLFGVMLPRREPIHVRAGGRGFLVPAVLSALFLLAGLLYLIRTTRWGGPPAPAAETTVAIGKELM